MNKLTKLAPLISISCVIFNPDLKLLSQTIDSVLKSLAFAKFSFCFYVIDNSSKAQTVANREYLQSRYADRLEYISGQGNVGYGRAHNLAIRQSLSNYHLVLNPDVIVGESVLYDLANRMHDRSDHILAFPMVYDEHGNVSYLCKTKPGVLVLFARFLRNPVVNRLLAKPLSSYEYKSQIDQAKTFEPEIVGGCFMFFNGKALRKLNGFDERFFLYFEDFDLSLRAGQIGRIIFHPDLTIVHHGGGAGKKGWRHIKMFIVSAFRFFNKHGWKLF